FVLFYEKLK
ncbi:hypothetical protein CP08DC60_0793B, partial [Chlamydia psittaci 08DC60]